jgi:hypothetical protein
MDICIYLLLPTLLISFLLPSGMVSEASHGMFPKISLRIWNIIGRRIDNFGDVVWSFIRVLKSCNNPMNSVWYMLFWKQKHIVQTRFSFMRSLLPSVLPLLGALSHRRLHSQNFVHSVVTLSGGSSGHAGSRLAEKFVGLSSPIISSTGEPMTSDKVVFSHVSIWQISSGHSLWLWLQYVLTNSLSTRMKRSHGFDCAFLIGECLTSVFNSSSVCFRNGEVIRQDSSGPKTLKHLSTPRAEDRGPWLSTLRSSPTPLGRCDLPSASKICCSTYLPDKPSTWRVSVRHSFLRLTYKRNLRRSWGIYLYPNNCEMSKSVGMQALQYG